MPGSSDSPPVFSVALKDEAAAGARAGENAPSHGWSRKPEVDFQAANSETGM